jgi:hypothetical protein
MRMDIGALAGRGTALLTAVTALTMVAAAPVAAGGHGGQAAETRQIASSVLGEDLKFTLTAVRSAVDPLAASVRLKAFVQRDGVWRLSDQVLVGEVDGWFWFPLTGRGAICEFSTASTDPAPVAVSLLITPSVGCSPAEHFQVRNGGFSTLGGVRHPHGAVGTGGGAMADVVTAPAGDGGEPARRHARPVHRTAAGRR